MTPLRITVKSPAHRPGAPDGTDRRADVRGGERGRQDVLAGLLADVLRAGEVDPDSDFFTGLGADSLLMARFCARIRKHPGLPAVSIKDVYAHPTVRELAAALGTGPDRAAPGARPHGPGSVRGVLLTVRGYDWIAAGSGAGGIHLRSVVFGPSLLPGRPGLPAARREPGGDRATAPGGWFRPPPGYPALQ